MTSITNPLQGKLDAEMSKHLRYQNAWIVSCLNRYLQEELDLNDQSYLDELRSRMEKQFKKRHDGIKETSFFIDDEWLLTSYFWIEQTGESVFTAHSQFNTRFGDSSTPPESKLVVDEKEVKE